jgi:hypothetical protein
MQSASGPAAARRGRRGGVLDWAAAWRKDVGAGRDGSLLLLKRENFLRSTGETSLPALFVPDSEPDGLDRRGSGRSEGVRRASDGVTPLRLKRDQ